MIGRRGFLQLMGAAVAGFVLDPDLALWVPGKKTFIDLHVPGPVGVATRGGGAFTLDAFNAALKDVYMPLIREQLAAPSPFVMYGGARHAGKRLHVKFLTAQRLV